MTLFQSIAMGIGIIVILLAGLVILSVLVAALIVSLVDIELIDDEAPLYDWDNEKLTFKKPEENDNN